MKTQNHLPEWLTQALDDRAWENMSFLCNWAHGLFTSDAYQIEVFDISNVQDRPCFRMMATINGYLILGSSKDFVTDIQKLDEYLAYIVPQLEKLDNSLQTIVRKREEERKQARTNTKP